MIIRNQRGMTLLEIMIVVAILGSLAAILGTRVVGAQKKAKVKQAKIQISEISKSLDMYYTDCGHYPSSEQGLAALAPGGESSCTNWGPEPYIKKIQPDPWGTPFVYIFDNGNYTLISYGEDKKEGGTGYNADVTSND
jgi:general secretion pathway protein G